MRNTDKVNFVGFSTGGTGTTGVKVRYAVDQFRRTQVLAKIGATNINWFKLPTPMTKVDAVQYLIAHQDALPTEQVYQEAIARASARLAVASRKVAIGAARRKMGTKGVTKK